MKKVISIILTLTLLCTLFAGCQSRGESSGVSSTSSTTSSGETGSGSSESGEASYTPLSELPKIHLCTDIGTLHGNTIQTLLNMVPGNGKDFVILAEGIPESGPERENTLTRIRTEILAGKGPDMFLCRNSSSWSMMDTRALFPFPEKAMANHIFLPLDDYIAGAGRMEWERFQPEVMAVGANDEGQQLLPISYSMNFVMFPKETYDVSSFQGPMTWEEMCASEDNLTRFIACYSGTDSIFGRLADYKKDCPLFSEEDLLAVTKKWLELHEEENSGGFPDYTEANGPDFPKYPYRSKYDITMGFLFTPSSYTDCDFANDDYWMLPCYNQEGGLTATVEQFCGINRNTEYPEECFRFFDVLLSPDAVHVHPLMDFLYPVDTTVGTEDWKYGILYMSAWNFDQYQAMLGEINAVNFHTEANDALMPILGNIVDEDMPVEEAVHKAYMKMSMLLGEA